MIYKEEKRDLFSVDNSYILAHCVSADFALGKGIAKEFDKRFNMKIMLKSLWEDYEFKYNDCYNRKNRVLTYEDGKELNCALFVDGVFNLVTKTFYYNKPTYNSLKRSLVHMRTFAVINDFKKIAMPKIGCGLDKLEWEKVSCIIKDVFKDADIEILVCVQ